MEKRWEVAFLTMDGEVVATLGPYQWKFQARRAASRYTAEMAKIHVEVRKLPSRIYG